MKRRIFRWIIFLTTISLLAAGITQLLWVRDALKLKEDQFAGMVNIAMKSVVNQLLTSEKYGPADPESYQQEFYFEHYGILTVVDPFELDSLLKEEILAMDIDRDYIYGVYRDDDSTFIMGQFEGNKEFLLESQHIVSLTCLCDETSYSLSVVFPDQYSSLLSDMIILPVMSGLFLLILVFSFFFTISSIIRQKKLGEMKTDFMNNMTHELKTPIATISASSEMLTKEPVLNDHDRIKKYAGIIFDENRRLRGLVERVLQIAAIDKDDVSIYMTEIEVHELIQRISETFRVQVSQRNGSLKTQLDASKSIINADRDHLINIFNNLLDNANKYSPENPEITITTRNVSNHIIIEVKDRGVGISKENQPFVFKKFHRLQRGDIHDVKGFGIGLYYVKSILEKMGAEISLKSDLNKGSRFLVRFETIG